MSINTLVTSESGPDFKIIHVLNFGDYMQVHKGEGVIKTTKDRTIGAIALHPSGSEHSGWFIVFMVTGRRIHGYIWNILPISDDVRREAIKGSNKIQVRVED